MLKTRRYINSFMEVKTDELETTVYNKAQAKELKQHLLATIEDLDSFIEDCTD